MTLPADVARCLGYGAAECNTCKRLAPADAEHQWWTGPWELEGVPCEMRIPAQSPDEHAPLLDARDGASHTVSSSTPWAFPAGQRAGTARSLSG
jgi:hypothetical protein